MQTLVGLKEVWRFREVIKNFVSQDLKVKYRRSYLGFFWSLLNPLLQLLVISAVFNVIFKFQIRDYALYVLSGLIPWTFLQSTIINSSMSIVGAEGMLKRQYFPKLVFPLSIVMQDLVTFVLSLVVLLCVLGYFIGFRLSPALIVLPVSFMYMLFVGLGVGAVAAVLTVYFRDVQHLIAVALSAIFYVTPIIYPMEAKKTVSPDIQLHEATAEQTVDVGPIPHDLRFYFKLNPFYSVIEMFHRPIYDRSFPTMKEFLSASIVAFGSLGVGLVFFRRFENRLIFHL
ncbi:MAG TPA: ABC transporter permease [Phycisphaerae bacterium]|nr:ABC transporter permease [Phycisphaerae bacterium]HRW52221.1 ABC transporter permease [Phycisphaerae bacterium]